VLVVIEVGVFTGYTTLAIAQALGEDGRVIGLDISKELVQEDTWKKSGAGHKVLAFEWCCYLLWFSNLVPQIDLRIGKAVELLQAMLDTQGMKGTVDLLFIDADKNNYTEYVKLAQQLVRIGGLIVIDNTLWKGRVLNTENASPRTKCLQDCNAYVASLDAEHWRVVNLPFADGVTIALRRK
jgi:O-methyltransferase